MINLILQNRQPTIYGDGMQKRSFSDIEDCIYCLDKLMTDPNIKSQIVNIGPDEDFITCLLYTSPSPRDGLLSRMPSSA